MVPAGARSSVAWYWASNRAHATRTEARTITFPIPPAVLTWCPDTRRSARFCARRGRPQGCVRARFDTQPPAGASTEGTFNQTFGSTGNDCRIHKADVAIPQGRFQAPVWVDVLTGGIYAIPAESMSVNGTTYTFHAIPIYDAPVEITDKSLLKFVPAKKDQAATLGG
jgi:hypothetical protein